jgi:prolyl oligopeptidase PreP (S9A serine peptidase family)
MKLIIFVFALFLISCSTFENFGNPKSFFMVKKEVLNRERAKINEVIESTQYKRISNENNLLPITKKVGYYPIEGNDLLHTYKFEKLDGKIEMYFSTWDEALNSRQWKVKKGIRELVDSYGDIYEFSCNSLLSHCVFVMTKENGFVNYTILVNLEERVVVTEFQPTIAQRSQWIDDNNLLFNHDQSSDLKTRFTLPTYLSIYNVKNSRVTPANIPINMKRTWLDPTPIQVSNSKHFDNQRALFLRDQIDNYIYTDYLVDGNKFIPILTGDVSHKVLGVHEDKIMIVLRNATRIVEQEFKSGDVITIPYMRNKSLDYKNVKRIFSLREREGIISAKFSKKGVLINFVEKGLTSVGLFAGSELERNVFPEYQSKFQTLKVIGASPESSLITLYSTSSIDPPKIRLHNLANGTNEVLYAGNAYTDRSQVQYDYQLAPTTDGEEVSYYIAFPKGVKEAPVVMDVHGASRANNLPYNSRDNGAYWLSKGFAVVFAQVRGGEEQGAFWSQTGSGIRKINSAHDIKSITEHMKRNYEIDSERMVLKGMSGGGYTACLTGLVYPSLFSIVDCKHSVLDLTILNDLPHSNSWVGDFGDYSNTKLQRGILEQSPVHLASTYNTNNKTTFIVYASDNDENVVPIHSYRFIEKLSSNNYDYFFINSSGAGHGWGERSQYVKLRNVIRTLIVKKFDVIYEK